MKNDIEQRAEEYAKGIKKFDIPYHIAIEQAYFAAMTEERERGNKVFEELIQTIERCAIDNKHTILNVELWAKSWRKEKALNN